MIKSVSLLVWRATKRESSRLIRSGKPELCLLKAVKKNTDTGRKLFKELTGSVLTIHQAQRIRTSLGIYISESE